ncbi:Kelch-like protein diablo [Eumeta japonica]|uniref:Kelch-like protein diablo n=1 Tax=Eumeta variegata TaxID=151549 RepID=A0A4C1XC23_EUMVA|nr:Kelch-like protein diablo [Eumeta japonica]
MIANGVRTKSETDIETEIGTGYVSRRGLEIKSGTWDKLQKLVKPKNGGGKKDANESKSESCQKLPITHFCVHTGQTEICSSTVPYLVDAADMLQLKELSAGCSEYLKNQLHPSNVLDVIRKFKICSKKLEGCCKRDELLNMPFTIFMKLVSSDKLAIDEDDEVQVLHTALRWLDHHPASRKQHCMEILEQMRLRKVSQKVLNNTLANIRDPSIAENLKWFKVALTTLNREPRFDSRSYLYLVGGLQSQNGLRSAVKFDGKVWKQIESMNKTRNSPRLAAMGGLVYAVGGRIGIFTDLANGEVYDPRVSGRRPPPATNKWRMIAPMRKARDGFGLAAVNDKLYAFGGFQDSSIEVYHPEINEWFELGQMPEPRFRMNVVTYGGAVYLVGGQVAHEYMADILCYIPERAQWRRLRPLLADSNALSSVFSSSVVHGSSLYVVGRVNNKELLICYNLQTVSLVVDSVLI